MGRSAKAPKQSSARRVSLWRVAWVTSLMVAASLGVSAAWLYHRHVVVEPGAHLAREHVWGVIAQESPVYYRDGVTRLGVFFGDEHRRFIDFEQMPIAYRAAIVASEDARFWSHPGFDVWHIGRAMRDNLAAGRMVAGGSTLTQQTAKNLYYRPDRSLRSKLIEALNALRLERHYSKSEILTFYANQFHVAGNGRGLGIAARHFFDKTPDELTVLESAFLAGLVKAPAYYDPFVGDADRRAAASERAHDRTRYVLGRLVEVDAEALAGPYPSDGTREAQAAYDARVRDVRQVAAEAASLLRDGFQIAFRRGVFRFDRSAVLDEVERRLAEPPFAEVLEKAGIDDPAAAGLKVITTLDEGAQWAATYGLWHHLTEVGVMLEAKTAADFVQPPALSPRFDPDQRPRPWELRYGVVQAVQELAGKRVVEVDLGGHACLLDRDALVRVALAVQRGTARSTSEKVGTAGVDAFIDALPVGAVVWVSVRSVGEEGVRCDLELRPELQGASIVLERGEVRAMVGGNDNRNFNRVGALRQMGSTWKPLVYHAALTLGWTPTDLLDNRRAVFPYSTTFYYPQPDHAAGPEVTLAWAGVRSENLASVWLLHHLLDRLDHQETALLAEQLGLARLANESEDDYRLRIQRAGVLPTPSRIGEALFLQARREVLASLTRSAHPEDQAGLASLLYGWGFDAERRRASEAWKLAALDWSWPTVQALGERCVAERALLFHATRVGELPPASEIAALRVRRGGAGEVQLGCGNLSEGWQVVSAEALLGELVEQDEEEAEEVDVDELVPEDETGKRARLTRRALKRLTLPEDGALWLDERVHVATVLELRSALDRVTLEREVLGEEAPGLYDPRVLYWHQDFRVLLALKYVVRLAATFGVRTSIREVLSLPLGASEVTLEEAASVYEGLASGQAWAFPGVATTAAGEVEVGEPRAATLLIKEIRDADDNVLYRAQPVSKSVSDPNAAAMTVDVLEQVIAHGTGQRAHGAVSVGGAALPLAGKTGTTNDFRNAAFLGLAPEATANGLAPGSGWVVGTYVGYDDNRPMVSGRIKLAGASGALPAWLATVNGLAARGLLGTASAPAEGWRRVDPEGLVRVPVDLETGLPAPEGGEGVAMVLTRAAAQPVVDQAALAPEIEAPEASALPQVDAILAEPQEDAAEQEGGGVWRRRKRDREER